jgi:hypothetical protein
VRSLNRALRISQVEALKSSVYDGFLASLKAIPGFKSFPVRIWLNSLREKLDKDLVVFFDEVGSLMEPPLVSFLSQLSAGYVVRTEAPFPRSRALVSARNFLSYKVKLSPEAEYFYVGECFNIVAEVAFNGEPRLPKNTPFLILGYADIAIKRAGKNYAIKLALKDAKKSKGQNLERILRRIDHFTNQGRLAGYF